MYDFDEDDIDLSYVLRGDELKQKLTNEAWDRWFGDEVIVKGRPQHPPRTGLHFSTASQKEKDWRGQPLFCLKKCVLAAAGYAANEVIHDPEKILTFDMGWHIHDMIQSYFIRSGHAVDIELQRRAKQWDFLFTADLLFNRDGVDYVGEIKGYDHKYIDEHVTRDRPDFEAHKQLNTYMGLLGVHQGIVLEVAKGKPLCKKLWKIWEVKYDPSMTEEIVTRLNTIKRATELHIQDGRSLRSLPDRICPSSRNERAQGCEYCEACFVRKEKNLHAMLLKGDGSSETKN